MEFLGSPIITTPADPKLKSTGSFVIGTSATFFYYFTDIDGQLYDPSDLGVTIKNAAGDTVQTETGMDKIEVGVFAYGWTIPIDSTPGTYTIRIDYTAETIDGPEANSITESFIVIEKGPGQFTLRRVAARNFLVSLLGTAQRVAVFNEIARMNRAKTVGQLTFPRWNQTAGIKVYMNGLLKEDGYEVDYLHGRIEFAKAISQHDEVTVDYNFRWFEDDDLDNFIEQGVNMVNIWPPQSVYNILNVPDRWMIAVEYGAAVNAIRRLLMDLAFQEPAKVFGGMKRASEIAGQLETLKKNYEEMLDKMLTQKKFIPYVGLTRTISNPIMTMPGGRCLKWDTRLEYQIGAEYQPWHSIQTTVRQLYNIFETGQEIYIWSNNDGNLTFEKVSKIWKSGEKQLLRITDDRQNSVEVSEDHIIFIDNKEKAAKDVIVGDILTVLTPNLDLTTSIVVSIEPAGVHETYDIEVPSTQNLFANNIQVHNSRWFRMLFSGN